MLKKMFYIVVIMSALILLSVFMRNDSVKAEAVQSSDIRKIVVKGTAQISIKPDTATINFSIENRDNDSYTAQESNAKTSSDVIESLKLAGIPEKDIYTTNYNMYQRNDYNNSGEVISTYFVVTNSLSVRTMDLKNVGKLIGIASKAGANEFNGVSFSASTSDKEYNMALKKAIENADSKAKSIAEAAGENIIKSLNIREISQSAGDVYMAENKRLGMNYESAFSAFDANIMTGDLIIRAMVEVEYEY